MHNRNLERMIELNCLAGIILKKCPELVYVGDPVLRQKAESVTLEEGKKIGELLQKTLLEYRKITGFGRGLAAPQIGLSKAVFVTYVDDAFVTYINPKILDQSKAFNIHRGTCLSCGFMSADVKQPRSITIEYCISEGEKKIEKIDGMKARLLLHEYNHLEGIVNIDIAEPGSLEFMLKDPTKEVIREI